MPIGHQHTLWVKGKLCDSSSFLVLFGGGGLEDCAWTKYITKDTALADDFILSMTPLTKIWNS